MTTYGYARVSTNGQDLAAQEAELSAAGCSKVFKEKVSGAKTDRAELAKLLHRIGSGDVLVVTRLDRLARSTREMLVTAPENTSLQDAQRILRENKVEKLLLVDE